MLAIAGQEESMARKPTVDLQKAINMLREGQSTQSVADFFGVSRQAIDLHRRKLIETGQLDDRRANRAAPVLAENKTVASETPHVSLDGLIELIIQAFDSLKKVPQLEAELAKYKQEFEKASRQIERLEKESSKRQAQETRLKLALPFGDEKTTT